MKTIDKNSNFKFVILYISEKYLIIFEISSIHNKKINTPPQTLIMFENSTLKEKKKLRSKKLQETLELQEQVTRLRHQEQELDRKINEKNNNKSQTERKVRAKK